MSIYKPTWLYIKQHNQTGLRYFGKTTKDPLTYSGSGTHWKRHIKKHGIDNVITVWCQLFTDKNELQEYALRFSDENNIVESKAWANLKPENGLDGALPGSTASDKTKALLRSKGAPAKDAVTGEKLGKIHSSDPRWVTGEIVHTSVGSHYSAEELQKRKGWKQSEAACKRISDTHKGSGNSQYGTTYIINHSTQQKSRIKKDLVPHFIELGWTPGNKHSYSYVKLNLQNTPMCQTGAQ